MVGILITLSYLRVSSVMKSILIRTKLKMNQIFIQVPIDNTTERLGKNLSLIWAFPK